MTNASRARYLEDVDVGEQRCTIRNQPDQAVVDGQPGLMLRRRSAAA
jgi:hypothetical protein